MKPNLIALLAVTLAAILLTLAFQELYPGPCPEDAALFWDGDRHTACLTLDDIPGWGETSWEYIQEQAK